MRLYGPHICRLSPRAQLGEHLADPTDRANLDECQLAKSPNHQIAKSLANDRSSPERRLLVCNGQLTRGAFMGIQLISCRLPRADSARLRSSLFHHVCRFVSFSSGGLASASESLCRGFGSRWFTERFHRNALVTHFQHGQVFCAARQLKDYAVTRCRLHQRAPQR